MRPISTRFRVCRLPCGWSSSVVCNVSAHSPRTSSRTLRPTTIYRARFARQRRDTALDKLVHMPVAAAAVRRQVDSGTPGFESGANCVSYRNAVPCAVDGRRDVAFDRRGSSSSSEFSSTAETRNGKMLGAFAVRRVTR